MNIMSHYENSHAWHLFILVFELVSQFPYKPFILTNDLLMNLFESPADICIHTQASVMVKFTCNLYSVFAHISRKHFKVY